MRANIHREWILALSAAGLLGVPAMAAAQDSAEEASAAAAAAAVAADADASSAVVTVQSDSVVTVQSDAVVVNAAAPAPASAGGSDYDVYVVSADNSANASIPPVVSEPPRTKDNLLGSGGMIALNIGPNYAFKDQLYTSGDRKINVATAGLEASIDLGYKFEYVGVFLELMLRGGTVVEDDVHYHCPSNTFNMNDTCFRYYSVKKGDWDTYFMGIGAMVAGYIPFNSWVFGTIGAGFLGYIGRTTDGDEAAYNYAFKASLGVNFAVTPDIAVGFAVNYEGMFDRRQSISPAFSLIYNY